VNKVGEVSLNDSGDPFDPKALRLSQDFAGNQGVEKPLTTVPVRKPGNQPFFQVHPDPEFRLETGVIELREDGETYLVAPNIRAELHGEVTPKILLTAVTRQGVLFLWPIKLPDSEGRQDAWNASAIEASQMAENRWIRLVANRSLGAYEVIVATGEIPPADWSVATRGKTFAELLRLAFRDRYVNSLNHPVVARLRGAK